MNDEDLPTLRLNPAYKRLLTKDTNDKDTRNYVKERYKSAIQLIKNIEQRKQTIMLAGTKPSCSVLNPMMQIMTLLIAARTQPSQHRRPTRMVEIMVNTHET